MAGKERLVRKEVSTSTHSTISVYVFFFNHQNENHAEQVVKASLAQHNKWPVCWPASLVTEPLPFFTSTTHTASAPPGPSFTLKAKMPPIFFTNCSPSCQDKNMRKKTWSNHLCADSSELQKSPRFLHKHCSIWLRASNIFTTAL